MKKALLIVDMSHDFVFGSLPVGKPAADIVPYIIDQAKGYLNKDDIVVVTMDEHDVADPHFELWPPHNVRGTNGQKLYGELLGWFEENIDHPNVWYVPKTKYNAFYKTGLGDRLRHAGVARVDVVGVCTDICDFLTLNGADEEGFKTAIHRRGVATFSPHGHLFIEQAKAIFHTKIID